MKKLLIFTLLLVTVSLGCSREQDFTEISPESNETYQKGRSTQYAIAYLYVRYAEDVTESEKEEIRNQTYKSFIFQKLLLTSCTNVEAWQIYYDTTGRPGPEEEAEDKNNHGGRKTQVLNTLISNTYVYSINCSKI